MLKNLKCELDLVVPCEKYAPEATEERLKISSFNSAEAHIEKQYMFEPNIILQAGQKLHGTIWRMKHASELFDHLVEGSLRDSLEQCLRGRAKDSVSNEAHAEYIDGPSSHSLPSVQLQGLDVKRWNLASEAPRFPSEENAAKGHSGSIYETILVRRCEELIWRSTSRSAVPFFSVAGFVYGGLHALAWSATFDSNHQRLLWRISSCVVMGGCPFVILQAHCINKWGKRSDKLLNLMVGLSILLYVLARGYLVVGCFINLFNLPIGVYKVPRWTAYVPHIT